MKLGVRQARSRLRERVAQVRRFLYAEPSSASELSVRFSPGAFHAVDQVERLLAESFEFARLVPGRDAAQTAAVAAQEIATKRLLSIPVDSDRPHLERHLATHEPEHELERKSAPADNRVSSSSLTTARVLFLSATLDELIRHRRGFWPRGALRLTFTAAALALLLGGGWSIHQAVTGPRDLMARATVTPTSRYLHWSTHLMDFHTDIEERPAAVYDLGRLERISHFTIENTNDFSERAAPMAIEVSEDGHEFRQVAAIQHQFKIWQPRIEPATARFVRVVATHRTYFHLKRVEAYE